MQFIADLQLHSKYSRATSPSMDVFEIALWASRKGIDIVATGDWTHPLWFREIKTHLKEFSAGLYELKEKPEAVKSRVLFLLSTEISSIYSRGAKVRRVHNLIFSPSLECCERFIRELQKRGAKLMSDGRPIVGLSSKEVLEIALSVDKNMLLIPAHAWTPWFSIFGSRSGFDSIRECFGELDRYIYAIETGLSSDPLMNWAIDELKDRSLVSFSDAHSGPKLGREATVFTLKKNPRAIRNFKLEYNDIAGAIKKDPSANLEIAYTIEFFPEEGKYHWSGHRKCDILLSPSQVKKQGVICPRCRQPLTIGVEDRVIALSGEPYPQEEVVFQEDRYGTVFVVDKKRQYKPFVSLVPLLEILKETLNSKAKSQSEYIRLIETFGTEFDILLKKNIEEVKEVGGHRLALALDIVRKRKVKITPGYDGIFGTVSILEKPTQKETGVQQQETLF